jgi:hypothetical protein
MIGFGDDGDGSSPRVEEIFASPKLRKGLKAVKSKVPNTHKSVLVRHQPKEDTVEPKGILRFSPFLTCIIVFSSSIFTPQTSQRICSSSD